MKRFFLLVLLAALVSFAVTNDADAAKHRGRSAHTSRARAPAVDRYAAIVIEATTGTVISETNPDRRLYPASLTKMMTLYLTFEAIQQGRLRKNDRIRVSSRAAMQEPSKLGLAPGSTIRVEDAILGLVTKSANDAAVTLAEALGGSESRFGEMMTRKALQLGMKSTNYVNASGLHNPKQYSSARDMALLGQALIRDYPRDYKYFSASRFVYAGLAHQNHNKLMNSYTGMDGIKTGYVYASGYNLAASAMRNGQRLIGVVFGGQTTVSRNKQMARLLDSGFEQLRDPRVAAQIDKRRAMMAAAAKAPVAAPQVVAAAASVPAPPPVMTQAAVESPGIAASSTTTAANSTSAARIAAIAQQVDDVPTFNAMGLVTEQGDTGEGFETSSQPAKPTYKPQLAPAVKTAAPVNTNNSGNWAVQVGAYNTHDASMTALRGVKKKLPAQMTTQSQYLIAPLMTSRGMIYRARLSGLGRDQATKACRILKGSCLVMAAE